MDKACCRCGETKPLNDFHRLTASKDGHRPQCKACHCAANSAYGKTERGLAASRKQGKRWRGTLAGVVSMKASRYKYEQSEKGRENQRRRRLRDPEKVHARTMINHEIEHGRVLREPCEQCGAPHVEAHHDDYSKPLDVRWLCRSHHREHHSSGV